MKNVFASAVAFLAATVAASPVANRQDTSEHQLSVRDGYKLYKGDGTHAKGWPLIKEWKPYSELWNINSKLMKKSCSNNGWGKDNTDQEIADIRANINTVSKELGVDGRIILAIIMRESGGCVRVPTTGNGVRNPGLMQSHNGTGTCYKKNKCTKSDIYRMIKDGTNGPLSGEGDGMKQTIAKTRAVLGNNADSRVYYAAARMYNSGSVKYSDMNYRFTSTACYVTDFANILMGRVPPPNGCGLKN